MRRLLKLAVLLCLCASPALAQRIVIITGGTVTANVTDSADFYVTLNQNVTGVTLTSTVTPATGYIVSMKFVQDATGSRTVVFGGNISTACAVNSTASSVTICRWQYTASSNAWTDSIGVTNGAATNPHGALVNVKASGAVGDTKVTKNCTTAGAGSKIVTSTDNPWVAADVGKFFEATAPAQGTDVFTPARKIASFQSAGQVTLDAAEDGTATPGSGQFCKWFTQDDTAAFQAATNSAKQLAAGNDPLTASPTLGYPSGVYCPPGGYTVSSTIFLDAQGVGSNNTLGLQLLGDGGGSHCIIYPTATFSGVIEPLCTGTRTGLVSVCQTSRSDIENINVEGGGTLIPSAGLASGQGWFIFDKCKNCTAKNNLVNDLGIASANTYIYYLFSASGVYENNQTQNGAVGGNEAACRIESSSGVLFSNNLCSNHTGPSMQVISSNDRGSGGGQITILNTTTDECGTGSICTVIQGSAVNFVGGTLFGGSPELLSVDATSSVWLTDVNMQIFGSSASNIPGMVIASGGTVYATGSTLTSNGTTQPIVSGPAGANFISAGANVYQNCVSGVCNPITAANFATRGFSGGIIPKSSETHTPNTCYAVTGNLLATAQNLCTFLNDQNYQVLNITAQSGGTTPANSACATPPVITLSDGTRTATLTMTTGKTQWASNVDASTVGAVFATGTTLTISIGANTCTTPPVNVAVSYVLQSVINP